MKKVVVGVSGGVDSAVAAALLKQRGFDVLGVFLWCYQTKDFPCTTDQDRAMAVKVCHHLDIPIKILDLRKDYKKAVIDYFFSEYKAGRTPNPDVVCNKEIKFGLFYKKAIEAWKMDYVATGHYARILNNSSIRHSGEEPKATTPESNKDRFWTSLSTPSSRPRGQNDGIYYLAKGLDDTKDQSYFLYTLKENQLEHILFPVGDYTKEQVRKTAERFRLPNWDRPDSQGICFVGEVDIKKFLSTKFEIRKGAVVNLKNEVIGEHDGVWFYTIGQRHGFKITEDRKWEIEDRNIKPLYVLSKNSERNELVVEEKEECFRKEFEIEKMHLINESKRNELLRKKLSVRIRHLGEMYPCKISPITNNSFLISLSRPAFAVAPGQSAVLYNKDIVLGGGIIK